MNKDTKNEKEKNVEPPKLDELLMYNLKFANQLELDIHKLLITLSTGAVVLSVSLLKLFPLDKVVVFSHNLMWSWYYFGVSIISGVSSLILKTWWFGNKFMIDRVEKRKYQKRSFRILTTILGTLGSILARIQEVSFFIAIILMIIFAIKTVTM